MRTSSSRAHNNRFFLLALVPLRARIEVSERRGLFPRSQLDRKNSRAICAASIYLRANGDIGFTRSAACAGVRRGCDHGFSRSFGGRTASCCQACPLVLVRKLGTPLQPELAMGAIADGGSPIVVRNNDAIEMAGVSEADFAAACRRELKEIERRRTFVLRRSAASGGQRDASPLSSTRTRRFASRSTQILRGHSRERWANGPAATKACRTGRVDQRQTNERSR